MPIAWSGTTPNDGGVRKEVLPPGMGEGYRNSTSDGAAGPLRHRDERQGQGLGRDLLIEAIERAADAGTHVAARFIAVDPIDEAAVPSMRSSDSDWSRETWKGACTSESTRPWPPSRTIMIGSWPRGR